MNQIKKLLLSACLMCSYGVGVNADTVQAVTINGVTVSGKTVSTITFSGDDAVLTYSDNTTETAPMEQVVVVFSDPSITGINNYVVSEYSGIINGKLTVGGLTDGTSIRIYDASGKEKLSLKASSEKTVIDVSGMSSGMYIMRAGNMVVKFVKQ